MPNVQTRRYQNTDCAHSPAGDRTGQSAVGTGKNQQIYDLTQKGDQKKIADIADYIESTDAPALDLMDITAITGPELRMLR